MENESLTKMELKNRIEELESQLAISRAANKANWRRFLKAQGALYGILRWADVSLSKDQLRALSYHASYQEACDILGWNFDWSAMDTRYRERG